jgi:hypothetical protein
MLQEQVQEVVLNKLLLEQEVTVTIEQMRQEEQDIQNLRNI